MPTKELLVDIGNYLEGNYNMGGSTGKALDDAFNTNIQAQAEGGQNQLMVNRKGAQSAIDNNKFDVENNAIASFNKGVLRGVDEISNALAGDPRGHNREQQRKRDIQAQAEAMANRTTGAFAQDNKKKKKKKGLLAMNTPSAKASRFRSGKRRFRVKPGSGTGVNVGGASGSASVGTS